VVAVVRSTSKLAILDARLSVLGHDKIRASITRADIATLLLDQVADRGFVGATPAISD
jgi:hypothetical protein